MSETDDTDDLLMIPPDFFTIQSQLETPYYNIVDTLITQVNKLQGRIDTIESTSDLSVVDSYLDNTAHNMANFTRYKSADDIYTTNNSTPQKPGSGKFKISSLPNTPNVNRFSPRKYQNQGSVSEVDSFLSHVKKLQRARNLQHEFNEISNTNNNRLYDHVQTKQETWRCGDNIESVPDYGVCLRDTLYESKRLADNKTNGLNSSLEYNNTQTTLNDSSDNSSSESTQATTLKQPKNDSLIHSPLHSNAINVLNMHKQLLETSPKERQINRDRVIPRSINTITDNVGLMNLADIWNGSNISSSKNNAKMLQKLQEEQLRRQHCEALIHELQTKNLELQQKMAVAVKVDESKNNTIREYQETLEKYGVKLEKLSKDKLTWEEEVARVGNKYKNELADAKQKISLYEKEVSKALQISQSNKETICSLERRCVEQQNDLESAEKKFLETQNKFFQEFEKNKQLTGILSQKEIEISQHKTIINDARSEISQSKRAVEQCQKEFNTLKSECAKHQNELRENKSLIVSLNDQKRKLLNEVETLKSKEKSLQEEITKLKKQVDTNKVDLRNFYQGQVEILVQNKLKEFQEQLDKTENNCKEEIKRRELSIAKTAASHIQQISEKFTLEKQLLETKHVEELKLYKMQVVQQKHEIDSLQSKISAMQDRRQHLTKQLQKIMEAQWSEAMRIIANGRSPTIVEADNQQSTTSFTMDQLNSLKTKSYHNFEEVLLQQEYMEHRRGGGPVTLNRKKDDENLDTTSNEDINVVDTPVSSKNQKLSDNDLQRYVNLLLNKQPGNPTADMHEKANVQSGDKVSNWQADCTDDQTKDQNSGTGKHKDRKYSKRPWK